MEDYDLIVARQLQEEFDKEVASLTTPSNYQENNYGAVNVSHSNAGLSVIDPSWETTDPNPDVLALFIQFDRQYFGGKLAGVEVKWSPRMTLCAGVCSYEGRGGLCSIRLSVPLLKLRPRKDLVETLLHEMIHAYLFVTENDRDRDGHGPNFQKHMHRINKASGANITIYHDFHDEVDNYRQHWWRCNGPCQKRPPYYGWVKRAMNRAPSAQDFWWPDHQRSCGGTYTKVKEPEGYGGKKKGSKGEKKDSKAEQKNPGMDIRTFLGTGNTLGSSEQNKKPSTSSTGVKPCSATITGPASNHISSKNGSVASAVGKTGGKEPTNDKKSVLPDNVQRWTGGIWTPEKDSGLSSDFQKPVQKKSWTVVEVGKDKEVKADLGQCERTGHVLGSDSSDCLNWLAQMRKQWASADSDHGPSTSTPILGPSDSSKQQHDGHQTAKPFGSYGQREPNIKPEKESSIVSHAVHKSSTIHPDDCAEVLSLSDCSFHDSFHVSSCEEDNWPTPKSYKHKDKSPSSGQSKRKRIFVDLTSSDDEDVAIPVVAKRPKFPTKDCVTSGVRIEDITLPIMSKHPNLPNISKHLVSVQPSSSKTDYDNVHLQDKTKSSDLPFEYSHNDASVSDPTNTVTTDASMQSFMEVETSFVDCPSCQTAILAENINSHLDMCLS